MGSIFFNVEATSWLFLSRQGALINFIFLMRSECSLVRAGVFVVVGVVFRVDFVEVIFIIDP